MKKFLILIITISMVGCVSPEDQARIDGATMFQSGMQKYIVNVEKVDAEFTAFENGDLQFARRDHGFFPFRQMISDLQLISRFCVET